MPFNERKAIIESIKFIDEVVSFEDDGKGSCINALEEIKKSSKGYEILKTVYSEYKLKGLIPKDFPVKTVREVLTIATNLDKLLEKQIFDQVVDMRLFAAIKEFGSCEHHRMTFALLPRELQIEAH